MNIRFFFFFFITELSVSQLWFCSPSSLHPQLLGVNVLINEGARWLQNLVQISPFPPLSASLSLFTSPSCPLLLKLHFFLCPLPMIHHLFPPLRTPLSVLTLFYLSWRSGRGYTQLPKALLSSLSKAQPPKPDVFVSPRFVSLGIEGSICRRILGSSGSHSLPHLHSSLNTPYSQPQMYLHFKK